MNGCKEQQNISNNITEDFEQRVLQACILWYQQENTTIDDASSHAYTIARDTVKGLAATQVVSLLQEHPKWTYQNSEERYASDKINITIGEITRRHFVQHLEKVIQKKGLKAVYAAMTKAQA